MQADRDIFIDRIRRTDRDTLLSLAVSLYDELAALKLLQRENERISTRHTSSFRNWTGNMLPQSVKTRN